MEDEVLRNIGNTIIECECSLIEIIGISILEFNKNHSFLKLLV